MQEQKDTYSESNTVDRKQLDQEFINMQIYSDKKLNSIFGNNRKQSGYNNENKYEMIIDEELIDDDDNLVILENLPNFDASASYDRVASTKFKDLFFKKYQFMLDEINERLDNKYSKIYQNEKMIEVKSELISDEPYIEDKLLDVCIYIFILQKI